MFNFTKVRDVKSPNRGTNLSAGVDFYIPNFSDEYVGQLLNTGNNKDSIIVAKNVQSGMSIFIKPHSSILIPAGIKVIIPRNSVLTAFNKSGVATKKKLIVGACVIDADYRGEVHIHLINTSDDNVSVEFGDKIIQFVLTPVFYDTPKEVSSELYMYIDNSTAEDTENTRGTGGFGSTGTK